MSITSHIIKLFEKVIRNRLVDYLERNGIFKNNQHGFRKKRSCLTQLLTHVDHILKSLNSGNKVDVIYLDYAKAFDKVDHNILLAKLWKYGIQGKLYRWIRSFVSGRKQTVVVEGSKSTFKEVTSGVPQGTVLAATLFILYAMDLISLIKYSRPLTFADDTKLTQQIVNTLSRDFVQMDLETVIKWSDMNNMKLHEQKFEVLNYVLNSSNWLRELPYYHEQLQYTTSEGHVIDPSASARDLGVIMTNDCKWYEHIKHVVKGANTMASWVLSIFRDRSDRVMLILLKSMVRPTVEYCCPLWDPYKTSEIQSIENIQRQFTRRIGSCKGLVYWDRLKKLHILSLQRRRERYSIIHVWKIYHGEAPNDSEMEFYTHDSQSSPIQQHCTAIDINCL